MADARPSTPVETMAALCLRCGRGRRLALARCEACGHVPSEEMDRAAHIVAMERSSHAREELGRQIAGGRPFEPDAEELASAVDALRAASPVRVGMFALVVVGGPLVLMTAVLAVLAGLLLAL